MGDQADQIDAETRKEALFILNARLADIRELKQEQWRYGYTALIALTGLLASVRVPIFAPDLRYRLLVIAGCIGVVALWWNVQRATERALDRSRAARDSARKLLTEPVQSTHLPDLPRPDDLRTVARMLTWAIGGEAVFVIIAAWAR